MKPFMPFTYAIDGFRETITYANPSAILGDLGILAAAMRSSYKTGPQEALDFILGASSPDDFISRVYYMDRTNKKRIGNIV